MNKIINLANKMPQPKSWRVFGLLLLCWWVGSALCDFSMYSDDLHERLMRGEFPPEADSISIPLGNWVVAYIIMTIMLLPYFLWAIWSYSEPSVLIVFSKDRCIRSSIAWLITAFWIYLAFMHGYSDLMHRNFVPLLWDLLSLYLAIVSNAAIQNKLEGVK